MTDQLLTDFAYSFFGYGHLDAPIWFVGMEEGGGTSRDEIVARLRTWNSLGRQPVVDIRHFGDGAGLQGHSQWFQGDRPPLQSTWSQLIRIALSRAGEDTSTAAVRRYQRDVFASATGEECLMELLPLPSPSTDHWMYGDWFEHAWLRSRDTYRDYLLKHRIQRLRELIEVHQPQAVVFYSRKYLEPWCEIIGAEKELLEVRDLCERADKELPAAIYDDGITTFVVTYHPVAFGMTNRYYQKVGELLR